MSKLSIGDKLIRVNTGANGKISEITEDTYIIDLNCRDANNKQIQETIDKDKLEKLVDKGLVKKIVDPLAGTVLGKYVQYLEAHADTLVHLRVAIREDEQYGEAIVEAKDGTPSGAEYNKDKGAWE